MAGELFCRLKPVCVFLRDNITYVLKGIGVFTASFSFPVKT